MGRRKRATVYRNGDVTLGERDKEAVADFRDEAGRRRRARLGVKFKDAEAARRTLDAFAEDRRALKARQASYTIGDLWKLWLAERARDKLSNDIYNYNWTSLRKAFESRHPETLTTQDCRDYAQARFELNRSPWTVHTELSRLSVCLKWAHEARLIPWRPKVWIPQAGKPRDRVLSIDEAQRLVEAASKGDPHVFLFVVLLFATGARHTAILDLTWDRINFDAGTIKLEIDLPPDPMSKSWRKGRAIVAMNATARKALKVAHAGRQTKFVIEHGGRRLKSCREGFRSACERARLTDVTPHTIRHTVNTWLDEQGVSAKRRAQLLGHEDERTTETIYSHAGPSALSDAVTLLDVPFAPLPVIAILDAEAGDGAS